MTKTKTVIRRIWLENIKALIRQESGPVLQMIADYESGQDVAANDEYVTFLRGHGTRIEAAMEYLDKNHKQKPKPARKKTKKADKEVI